jgi:hypothetical protein
MSDSMSSPASRAHACALLANCVASSRENQNSSNTSQGYMTIFTPLVNTICAAEIALIVADTQAQANQLLDH